MTIREHRTTGRPAAYKNAPLGHSGWRIRCRVPKEGPEIDMGEKFKCLIKPHDGTPRVRTVMRVSDDFDGHEEWDDGEDIFFAEYRENWHLAGQPPAPPAPAYPPQAPAYPPQTYPTQPGYPTQPPAYPPQPHSAPPGHDYASGYCAGYADAMQGAPPRHRPSVPPQAHPAQPLAPVTPLRRPAPAPAPVRPTTQEVVDNEEPF